MALLAGFACGRSSERTAPSTRPPIVPSTTTRSAASNGTLAESPPGHHLEPVSKQVDGRGYRLFSAAGHRVALRLERPQPRDAEVLLSVAGTYTSPADAVEGFVMVDGELKQSTSMAWAGRLVIVDGLPQIDRASPTKPLPTSKWKAASATVFQGHLLVYEGKAQPLKPSPLRQRRALVTFHDQAAIVESDAGLPLATFATDLVRLGAIAALNLDMGGWSEGWARLKTGTMALGENHSQTRRQSNWLVIIR